MENNKLIIGVELNHKFNPDPEQQIQYRFDLMVLRDLTLRQLLTAIYYGCKAELKSDPLVNEIMFGLKHMLYPEEQKSGNTGGAEAEKTKEPELDYFSLLHLRRYNEQVILEDENLRGDLRPKGFKFRKEHLSYQLCQLGFITSTELVFLLNDRRVEPDGCWRGLDTKNVNVAFKPVIRTAEEYAKYKQIQFPEYNVSSREIYQFDREPVNLISPTQPPKKPEESTLATMLPSMITMGVMLVTRSAASASGFDIGNVVMLGGMLGGSILSNKFLSKQRARKHKTDVGNWKANYQAYMNRTIKEIRERQANDAKMLAQLYPEPMDLANEEEKTSVFHYHENIFSRNHNDEDFLTIRLGTSQKVESLFPIEGSGKDEIASEAAFILSKQADEYSLYLYLNDELGARNHESIENLPTVIKKELKYLDNAPLLYAFRNSGALGIVEGMPTDFDRNTGYRFPVADHMVKRMIFDLCYHHSPEDLQFVIFFDSRYAQDIKPEDIIQDYRYLPHFHGLFDNLSQFVFDRESAALVMSKMLKIMGERQPKKEGEDGQDAPSVLPHIVFIVYDEYGLKEHAFARFLPEPPVDNNPYENTNGLSFIFVKEYKEYLPAYCTDIIRVEKSDSVNLTLCPRIDIKEQKPFYLKERGSMQDADAVAWDKVYKKAFDFFSGIYHAKIAQNGKVPSGVDMFELMDINVNTLSQCIEKNWGLTLGKDEERKYNVTKSLAVPIGKTESGLAYLDLHEKEDGPHMLVAGTTGSGKSETVISWLLSLCMCFRPDEVNLLLVDMKGGGFTKRLGTLPHVVGTVTDVDGDENGTGAAYMLRRFLEAIKSEIKRRKILLNKLRVDNIDDYIKACLAIEDHISELRNREENFEEKDAEEIRETAKNKRLTHLILVIDEFTELKRFSSENDDIDFISEITTIARVGRSLGYHICLISQNIQGAITEDISVNSKSRLCLKVATRQASKEMIGTDLAADPSMPGYGRAYLLVGTGSKFVYFQSAYSGARLLDSGDIKDVTLAEELVETPYEVTKISFQGNHKTFFSSAEDNTRIKDIVKNLKKTGNLKTQLVAITTAISEIYKNYKEKDVFGPIHKVFREPLGSRIALGDNDEDIVVEAEKKKGDANA